ncbi:hypothetical protein LSTR_LSTR003213 [Laodelphax striatellus]|uniref:Protein tweety homolog n=1 Tax=Laodelphax striatellus TaxID=195883 RepID=A0A482XS51_LAOST|nr:hypothetical protein LSTR_LSTR003213 [Laodelphax striatellus]
MRGEEGVHYRPPPLARFFHALPHVNISLHLVNSTFDPDSDIYLESLGILGSIPAAWLILTLFLLLIYLLTRCCDRKPRPKHSIVILKWTLSIFTVLCCGAVGVGLYGNDDVHNGVLELLAAARSIDDSIGSVKNQTSAIESTLKLKVQPLLVDLGDTFDKPVANQTARAMLLAALQAMTGNTTASITSLHDIMRPLRGVSLAHTIHTIHLAEAIRSPMAGHDGSPKHTTCVLCCIIIWRSSPFKMCFNNFFGVWTICCDNILAACIRLSHCLCYAFVEHESPSSLQSDILEYYTSCNATLQKPLWVVVRKGTDAVKAVSSSLSVVSRLARQLYQPSELSPKLEVLSREVSLALNLISGMGALIDCPPIHREYMHALHAVCDLGLFGLTFMLAAAAGAGFFFTILVWLDSHTWIYIRKKRDYLQVDEQDPFLPPTAASQAIAARTLRSQGDGGRGGGGRSVGDQRSGASHPPYGGAGGEQQPQSAGQYATLSRKFRTLDHHHSSGGGSRRPYGPPHHLEAGNAHTLGSRRGGGGGAGGGSGPGQYSTLSKKCKTLESSDFY